MQSKNSRGTRVDDLFSAQEPRGEGSMSINPGPLDLRAEFQRWQRANRTLGRHWVVAERLGARAIRAARWERGMVMLRGIHIEIAHRKIDRL